LRRAVGAPSEGPRVRIARRVLDLERRVLIDPADGNEERMTAGELDLWKIFAENPYRPLMRDWLLEVTAHREADAFDRAIDLRITRLRRKGRDRSRPSRGDPNSARGRLHVRPVEKLINNPTSGLRLPVIQSSGPGTAA